MRQRFVSSSLFFLTLCAPLSMTPIRAQTAPAKIAPDAILKGEIRLDGRITAMTGPNGFDINAVSFTSQAGKKFEFEEAKAKSILGDDKTRVVAGDDLERPVQWKEVKLGMRVAIIGRDGGAKGLQARLIVLSDYSSKYVKGGSVRMSRPVAMLVARGAALFEAKDYEGAIKIYRQAATMGVGLNDRSGAASAYGRIASAYNELNQKQNAEAAFKDALKVAEGAPDNSGLGTLYNNYGMLLLSLDRPAEAVKMLEKSNTLKEGQPEEAALVTTRNLARAYLDNTQAEKAVNLWRSTLPIYTARNEPDQIAEVQIGIAVAQRELKNAAGETAALTAARENIEKTTDASKKAEALAQMGAALKKLNDKEGARAAWNKAIELFNGAGDARNAGALRRELETLDAPETPPAASVAPAAPTVPAPTPDVPLLPAA